MPALYISSFEQLLSSVPGLVYQRYCLWSLLLDSRLLFKLDSLGVVLGRASGLDLLASAEVGAGSVIRLSWLGLGHVAAGADLVEEVTVVLLANSVARSDVVSAPSLVVVVVASFGVRTTMLSLVVSLGVFCTSLHALSLVEEVLSILHEVDLLEEEVRLLVAEALGFEHLCSCLL